MRGDNSPLTPLLLQERGTRQKMKYIDIHCHLDFPDYGDEISGVLERMKENEVGAITIGTDIESAKRAVKLAEENENVWACIGVHPVDEGAPSLVIREGSHDSEKGELFDTKEFEKLVVHPKVVAIGECGLDWFRIDQKDLASEKKRQTALFESQINFAIKHNKPLMLHCRNSYDDVLDILESYKNKNLRGNAHFFAGTVEQAKRFLDLGFTLSFTGVITFTHDYDEVIKSVPIESIMSETDAPFVAPVPHRGKRNEPCYVIEVIKKIAEIKGEPEELVREVLLKNALQNFNIVLG